MLRIAMFTDGAKSAGSDVADDAKFGSSRPEDLALPRVAWPTLLILALVLGLWYAAFWLAYTHRVSFWITSPMAILGAFLAFTPMHDSSHRSVAQARWVNEVVGRLATLVLFGHYRSFRYIHLTHHKHTNDPEHDPDFWSGAGPKWQLPLRWLSQDLHYYYVYIRAGRPTNELVEICVTSGLFIGACVWLTLTGHGSVALLQWLVPARVAAALLAFSFDWLPHQPHDVTAKADRYRATHVYDSKLLTFVLTYQNYHLIHHLHPAVPFYRYTKVWARQRELYAAKGTKIVTLPV
jgi:beta-carotene hydroxylase